MTNVVQLLSHSIEAHDMLKLYHSIGVEALDVGGYIDPAHPHDPKRPALPEVTFYPELKAAVDALGTDDNLGAAQSHIPDAILDWADVIVAHHYLDRVFGDWGRLRQWLRSDSAHRIIWRTVGQSVEHNERSAQFFRNDGLEIVRYSPKERNLPSFAGEDALIRFYKDPAEWHGWVGYEPAVLNISQHDSTPHGRDTWLNWGFWEQATEGLPTLFAGPHSELIGGMGTLSLEAMQQQLRSARCYLYTGTQPASYTLGLIEAMMTGIPVISIGPAHMTAFPYGPDLFEGGEIALNWTDDPAEAHDVLQAWLDGDYGNQGELGRQRAIDLFGMDTIAAQWRAFLHA